MLTAVVLSASAGIGNDARALPRPRHVDVDEQIDCDQWVPDSVHIRGVTDDSRTITLDVLVLLDGVSRRRGSAVMKTAAEPYAPLGISLKSSFRHVKFKGTDAYALLRQARSAVGDRVPGRYDVVYVLTSKNIALQGDPEATVGFAQCIGGVRSRMHAFAVGENLPDEEALPPIAFYDLAAKVAAHEIGHLMGAHHHYANCVEGIPSDTTRDALSVCTLMFSDISLTSLIFSPVNGAVVRGHAVNHATP